MTRNSLILWSLSALLATAGVVLDLGYGLHLIPYFGLGEDWWPWAGLIGMMVANGPMSAQVNKGRRTMRQLWFLGLVLVINGSILSIPAVDQMVSFGLGEAFMMGGLVLMIGAYGPPPAYAPPQQKT